ncbi:MAG: energy transducer TonB [Bacteroidota bacterium]
MNSLIKIFVVLIISSICLLAQEKELDKMPSPDGGMSAIAKNVKYPISAKESGIEGKVLITATIDKTGKVTKTEIVNSVNEDCDKAAIDAIKKTKWLPAEKDGKAVSAEITIPIQFKLGCKPKDSKK